MTPTTVPGYAQRLNRVIDHLQHDFPDVSIGAINTCVKRARVTVANDIASGVDYGSYARRVEDVARGLLISAARS